MLADTLWQDIRFALRGLRRQPGFALPVIFALALGIGANTAMFTVLNGVVLKPVALRAWKNPGRVLALYQRNSNFPAFFAEHMPARPSSYREWKQATRSFQTMAAWQDSTVTLTGDAKPEPVQHGAASVELFPLMGISPRLGRNFSRGETQVTLISDELYRSRFGSRRDILGTTLTANGKPFTIIGVLPPGIAFPEQGPDTSAKRPLLWTPLVPTQDESFSLQVYARLRDGVEQSTAQAEMRVIESRIARERKVNDGTSLNMIPLLETATDPDTRSALLILQIAVGFVLLIACANAGNLLLTRTVAREREMAIRSALGASSARLTRQIFTESVLLTLAATAAGLLLAGIALQVLSSVAPHDAVAFHEFHADPYVVLFTIAATLVTAILFALAPAYYSRSLVHTSRTATTGPSRLRGVLAVAEIALSIVLVIGAGLMLRSFAVLMGTDLGFRIDHLIVMRLNLPEAAYATPARLATFDSRLLESVRGMSGVESAALTTGLPLKALTQSSFEIPGRPTDPKNLPIASTSRVTDRYFETMGMRLIKGRTLTHDDVAVAVVNQAFERTYFPSEGALGKLFSFSDKNYRIAGVVGNERQMGPDNDQGPALYVPGSDLREFLLVARTRDNPTRFVNALKQQVWNIDRNQPVAEVMTEEAALKEWLAPMRFNMTVLLTFASIAILLAATGLYSVLAYTVSLRKREIGVRVAIGATTGGIIRFIMKGGLKLAIPGILLGLAASVALTRFMASLLSGVDTLDPITFAAVTSLVLFVAIAASYIPALRAARIDPVEALRAE